MEAVKKSSVGRLPWYGGIWICTYILCLLILKKMEPATIPGIMLSFLPTITFILFIINFARSVNSMDEVERRIQLEAAVWGFTLGLLLLMTLGLLDLVVPLSKANWGYRHLVPYFFSFYMAGLFISKRKYSFDNEKHD